jgi:hypothetical protein
MYKLRTLLKSLIQRTPMKSLITALTVGVLFMLSNGCTSEQSHTVSPNNDPALVGKWVRRNRYHLQLYANGIGSKKKGVEVTEDIKKFKKERINWVTFNNNFILINSDEKTMGFSYQIIGDTFFMRQPDDGIEYFIRVKEEKKPE